MTADLLEIGRIGKVHGLRGEVVVTLTTNRADRLSAGTRCWAGERELVVRSSRPHQDRQLVHFEGIDGREAAEELRGIVLRAEPIDDPDELWVHELIGSTVTEQDGTSRGLVESVLSNPASDLLVLESGALVPLTFVVETSPGSIVIDPPAGLFDLDNQP